MRFATKFRRPRSSEPSNEAFEEHPTDDLTKDDKSRSSVHLQTLQERTPLGSRISPTGSDTALRPERSSILDDSLMLNNGDPSRSLTQSRRCSRHHINAWRAEIIWCLLIIIVFIAMAIMLSQFDNKEMPKFTHGLTLNTVLAVFSTLCRAMMVVPVVEGLSQLKWNWFVSEQRPLIDIQYFNAASRGPWGALLVLPRARGRFIPLTILAALVLASGLATSFLTQSTIAYDDRLVEIKEEHDEYASFARAAHAYPMNVSGHGLIGNSPFLEGMTSAAYQTFFMEPGDYVTTNSPKCNTADCEWSDFGSLAICVAMGNVSDHIEIHNPGKYGASSMVKLPSTYPNATLSDRLQFITEGYARMAINVTSARVNFDGDDWPVRRTSLGNWARPDILNATFSQLFMMYASFQDGQDEYRFQAVEVLFHFCVHTYRIVVENGNAQTMHIGSTTRITDIERSGTAKFSPRSMTLTNEQGNQNFTVTSANSHSYLNEKLGEVLSGTWSDTGDGSDYAGSMSTRLGAAAFQHIDGTTSEEKFQNQTWLNIKLFTTRTANGMTEFMRKHDSEAIVFPKVFDRKTHVIVRWPWLAILIVQIVLTVVFLVAVIIDTANLGIDVIKSSNTAELFALGGGNRNITEQDMNASSDKQKNLSSHGISTKIDNKSTARLTKEEGSWNLGITR